MKKTLNLSIGGALFHVEEDAFEKLDSYINSIRAHFKDNADKDEILRDIEGRIAEKFSEGSKKIIGLIDAESVIEAMGTVEQFDGIENEDSEEETPKAAKRLYRDQDNAIIGGVAAGLGHFFGVDPIVFRLIFLVSIFAGGTGIIVYIILWLIIPEAKTPSQKLAMRGNAVTISAMADMIKEKINEAKTPENKNLFRKIISIPVDVIRGVAQFIGRVIFPSIRVILGFIILIGSFCFAVGATIFTSIGLFSLTPQIIDGPLLPVAQSGMSQVFAISLYTLLLIPLIFAIVLGINLITKRNTLSKIAASSLLGVWFIAIVVAPATGSIVGMRVTEIVENDPYYKQQSQILDVGAFNSVVVTSDRSVRFVEGGVQQVEVRGRAQALTEVIVLNEDSILTIGRKEKEDRSCIICDGGHTEIIITTPDISLIQVKDSSRATGDVKGKSVFVVLDNSSSVNLDIKAIDITMTIEDSSRAHISGKADLLTLDVKNSSQFEGTEIEIAKVIAKVVNNSSADVYVTKTLNATITNASHVFYVGQPTVEKKVDMSSRLRSADIEERNQADY